MTVEELKQYHNIITECWRLLKEYHDIGNDDRQWDELVYKADTIGKKYNTNFSRKLIVLILCELEEQAKKTH